MNRFVLVVIFGSFLGTHSYTFAQERANEMVIRVLEPVIRAGSAVSGAQYLSGYRSSINGQTIEYHSSDPDADSALLVRGQSVAPSISWKSDPMPKPSGGYSQFIWLAGIECHGFAEEKDTHQFNFLINGRHWFTFKNAKDATAMNWQIAGKDGAQLSFNGLMTDQAGDLFGYMVLKVPEEDFERGKPLNLEVKGDNSGSADWYMTFQHPFNLTPLVRPEPALVRDGAGTAQVLRLSLDNLTEGRTVEVDTPNHEPLKAELKVGYNILRLPIPAATSETVWQIQFRINNKLAGRSTVRVSPVKKRDFYLLCYSHNDI